jgi:hypothetical protein
MPLSLARCNDAPRVDPEFQSLIAPLTPEERRTLELNIVSHGCRDGLVVWSGVLLDGHNRFEICTRLGIRYKTSAIDLPSRESAKLWIEENQIGRRNLSPDQRAAIAYRILQRRVAISKKERARKGGLRLVTACTTEKKPRERERTAKQLGISSRQVRFVSEIVKHSPEMLERIVSGTLTIKKAKQQLIEDSRNAKRLAALKTNSRGGGILAGDLSLLHRRIPDDSADLFLTDPPYHAAAIPLYGRLAELAQRKLRPGGLCVVMCGQLYLPQVLAEMTKHLDYYWLCAVGQKGVVRSCRILTRRVLNTFKPILIFARRPISAQPSHPFFQDLVLGTYDKEHHEWGQGVEQFQYFVERLTEPGGLVADPFIGGGATPIACKALNRRFIGTELDPGVAAATRARVAEFRKSQSKDH